MITMMDAPQGQRFSQVYLERDHPLPDSKRARRRLYRAYRKLFGEDTRNDLKDEIEAETGAEVPYGYYGPAWEQFFTTCEVRDLLDTVTILARAARGRNWIPAVEKVFREENLHYSVDPRGGVHFSVDQEFERNWSATLSGLGTSKYSGATALYENAQAALDASPPQTREAIRYIFDAVENVFRGLTGAKASRLGAAELDKFLRPVINEIYEEAERDFAGRTLASFKEWVNAAHNYRHVRGEDSISPPNIESAVVAMSSGAAYLRWLLNLSAKVESKKAGDNANASECD